MTRYAQRDSHTTLYEKIRITAADKTVPAENFSLAPTPLEHFSLVLSKLISAWRRFPILTNPAGTGMIKEKTGKRQRTGQVILRAFFKRAGSQALAVR
jgi:hypothetical protein